MLEANDIGRRTIELDLHLAALECQVQRGNAMNVGPMLAMLVLVVMVVVVVVIMVMHGSMIMPFGILGCQGGARDEHSRQRQYG